MAASSIDRLIAAGRFAASHDRLVAAGAGSAAEAAQPVQWTAADADSFARLAAIHGMTGIANAWLEHTGATSLNAGRRDHAWDALHLTAQLVESIAALSQAGIPAIALKGPALAIQLYDNVAWRTSSDLDLLIRPSDFQNAAAVLRGLGYEPAEQLGPHALRHHIATQHDLAFTAPGRALIELHWALVQRYQSFDIDIDQVWRNRTRIRIGGQTVDVPGSEDLLLLLAVHGYKHGWQTLDLVLDVFAASHSPPIDWPTLWQRARAWRAERIVRIALLLGASLFSNPAHPDALHHAITDARAVRLAAAYEARLRSGTAPPGYRAQLEELKARDSWQDQLRYMMRLALTPTSEDRSALRLPDRLHYGYWLVRPFRLAARWMRRRGGSRGGGGSRR